MSFWVIMLFPLIISGQSFSCGCCFPFLLSSRAWNCLVPQRRRNKRLVFFIRVFQSCPERVRDFFLPTLDVPVGKRELELKITNSKAFCRSCFWYFHKGWIYSGQFYCHKPTKIWTFINHLNYLMKEEAHSLPCTPASALPLLQYLPFNTLFKCTSYETMPLSTFSPWISANDPYQSVI